MPGSVSDSKREGAVGGTMGITRMEAGDEAEKNGKESTMLTPGLGRLAYSADVQLIQTLQQFVNGHEGVPRLPNHVSR